MWDEENEADERSGEAYCTVAEGGVIKRGFMRRNLRRLGCIRDAPRRGRPAYII